MRNPELQRSTTARPRILEPETLDYLAVDDPAALRSRRDLRRVHRAMHTRAILIQALSSLQPRPRTILELGAGDGTLMLGVAETLARAGWTARLALLDRQPCVDTATIHAYARAGWQATPVVADVETWMTAPGDTPPCDLVVTTLFLHHFDDSTLRALLAVVARRTRAFFACEPRRTTFALAASHLVGALGANAVTRRDAVLSVRAGFAGGELTALWPAAERWTLDEFDAGLFSHCLRATARPSDGAPL